MANKPKPSGKHPGKPASRSKQTGFRFKRGVTVGSVVAETDQRLLREAFVDNGQLDVLRDTGDPKSVLVGRTGAGKSALIVKLAESERVIRVRPTTLSLRYLTNSTILPYLTRLGVNLDPFYQLLWRHVFAMELIRHRFKLDDKPGPAGLIQRLVNGITGLADSARKRRALEYYQTWNPQFWRDADVRIKDITNKLQDKLKTELGGKLGPLSGSAVAEAGREVTVSREVIDRAQAIVNDVSLERIYDGLDVLRTDVLNDAQRPYYIVIDDLDKNWVEIGFAYDLIDALLDAVAEFAAMDNVKVVVALRENIVEALHSQRGKQRQQREKHRNLFLELRWSPAQLEAMIDARLKAVVGQPFGGPLTLDSLLPQPKQNGASSGAEYVLGRTFGRPRDLIDFVNECFRVAGEREVKHISWSVLEDAERAYSKTRLAALEDEWYDNHPGVGWALRALDGVRERFTIADLSPGQLNGLLAEGQRQAAAGDGDPASIPLACHRQLEQGAEYSDLWLFLMPVLYRVGAVGVKTTPEDPVRYAYQLLDPLHEHIEVETPLFVHPALHAALRVAVPGRPERPDSRRPLR